MPHLIVKAHCSNCGGDGQRPSTPIHGGPIIDIPCEVCNATGYLIWGEMQDQNPWHIWFICSNCGGDGIKPNGLTCEICQGEGKILWGKAE